jgi:hypothetical protein
MKRFIFSYFLTIFLLLLLFYKAFSWGFFAHKNINKLAIFTLPADMVGFYKKNIDYITNQAVAPDKRRYIVKEEGARHFIDLDYYQDTLHFKLPIPWKEMDSLVGEEGRLKHGVLPWHLNLMKMRLTNAFKNKNGNEILKLSAEIGHYIGDAHVPLHTCSNYNGQYTNQQGIHGLWESRIPELNFSNYDFWVGPAQYIEKPQEAFWKIVFESHALVDSVLILEKQLSQSFPSDQKYSFEERGSVMVKVYSKEYSLKYDQMLKGQVEDRMRSAVKMVGSIWYTCWFDAGKPCLDEVNFYSAIKEDDQKSLAIPDHEDCHGH